MTFSSEREREREREEREIMSGRGKWGEILEIARGSGWRVENGARTVGVVGEILFLNILRKSYNCPLDLT